MSRRFAFYCVTGGALPLVGLFGLSLAQPNPLEQRLRLAERSLAEARAELAKLAAENDRLRSAQSLAHSSAQAGRTRHFIPRPAASTDTIPNSPPATSHYRVSVFEARRLEEQYGEMMDSFGFDDTERKWFKQLIVDRNAEQLDIITATPLSDRKKQDAAQMTRDMKASHERYEAAIRQFLNNDEDYRTFTRWENSKAERARLESAEITFRNAGVPLSPSQCNMLLDVMLATRVTRTALAKGTPAHDPLLLDDARKQAIVLQAATFLLAQQVETLKKTAIAAPR